MGEAVPLAVTSTSSSPDVCSLPQSTHISVYRHSTKGPFRSDGQRAKACRRKKAQVTQPCLNQMTVVAATGLPLRAAPEWTAAKGREEGVGQSCSCRVRLIACYRPRSLRKRPGRLGRGSRMLRWRAKEKFARHAPYDSPKQPQCYLQRSKQQYCTGQCYDPRLLRLWLRGGSKTCEWASWAAVDPGQREALQTKEYLLTTRHEC